VHPDQREDVFAELIKHCIQSEFLKLRQYEPRPGSTFAGWFATVASRKITDMLKHDATIKKKEMPNPRDDDRDGWQKSYPSANPSPEKEAEWSELRRVFFALIRGLDERCRLLFRLRSRGYTNKEIARLRGLPTSESKRIGTQFSDCRKKFVRMLRAKGYQLSDFVTTGGISKERYP
jgi:RNA polymerase sigma factor (sigma-70 family)